MTDATIKTIVTGGQPQGVLGAGTVNIGTLVFNNNRSVEEPALTDAIGQSLAACPYPGLAHFGPGDARLFFGRNAAIDRLAQKIGRQSLAALVGASGSGKSSVVLAGLAPHLHRAGGWQFSYFRISSEPGHDPFLALALALVPLYVISELETKRLAEAVECAANLKAGKLTLRNIFASCRSRNKGTAILLIADQFEEVFTLVQDEPVRHRFIDTLLAGFPDPATVRSPEICLVLTLRADFYGHALGYRPLADALQSHVENLGPMNRKELEEAIRRPAESATVSFEPGLVETLLDDVENKPGSLPLLQFALREMWGCQEKREITRKSYDDLGGVKGALAQRAEKIFVAITENGANVQMAEAFRRLFTRLVTLGEGQEDTRRVVERQELGEEAWLLAQHLADEDNRLVVVNTSTLGKETAEVAHEALIRYWPKLLCWLNTDRAFQSWLRQINPSVQLWATNSADEGPLLRGGLLAQAQQWFDARPDDLSPAERALIEASLKAHRRMEHEHMFLETFKRSLNVFDLTDQIQIEHARTSKLREFVNLVPMQKTAPWERAIDMYGQALGLERRVISQAIIELAISESEAEPASTRIESLLSSAVGQSFALIGSASGHQHAYAHISQDGSVFGEYFNDALAGQAAEDGRGIVTVGSAFAYVLKKMNETQVDQRPSLYTFGSRQRNIEDLPLTCRRMEFLPRIGTRRALLAAGGFEFENQMRRTAGLLSNDGGFEVWMLFGDQTKKFNLTQQLLRMSDLGPDDCMFFHFSGHGTLDRTDSSLQLLLGDPANSSTMGVKEIADILKRNNTGSVVTVLDTSYAANGFVEFR